MDDATLIVVSSASGPVNLIEAQEGIMLFASTGSLAVFGDGGPQGPAGPAGPQGPSGGALVTTGVSVDTTMAANAAYYPDSTSLIIFQFPVSPTDGDVCKIFGYGSGGWQLDLRSGETVNLIGSTNTTSGPLGTIYSTHTNDSATFIYIGGAWLCDALEVGFS